MKEDPSLWQESQNLAPEGQPSPRFHLDEFGFLEALEGLVRSLGTYEGSKAIVGDTPSHRRPATGTLTFNLGP